MAAALGLAATAMAVPATEPMAQTAGWCRGWLGRADWARQCVSFDKNVKVLFVGDSITDFFKPGWGSKGGNVWTNHFGAKGDLYAMNLGVAGDRTEHVLWRLRAGQIDKTSAKVVVLMIGTNNIGQRPEEEETVVDTILGVKAVLDEIRARVPAAKVVLHPIFPRAEGNHIAERRRVELVNHELKRFADGKDVIWLDFNSRLLDSLGRYTKEMSEDALHPTEKGYVIWAEELVPHLRRLLGDANAVLPPVCPPTKKYVTLAYLDSPERSPLIPEMPFNWLNRLGQRRNQIYDARRTNGALIDVTFLGDSITMFWETTGKDVAKESFRNYRVLNAGFSGIGTQHLLWNIRCGGMLDGYFCRAVPLMIGTNNCGGKGGTPENVAAATVEIMTEIRARQPSARILYFPILPRGAKGDPQRAFTAKVNELVATKLSADDAVAKRIRPMLETIDLGAKFAAADGRLVDGLFSDGLHPTAKGYHVWAEAMLPALKKACGK